MSGIDEARRRAQRLGLRSVGAEVYVFPLAKFIDPGAISIGDHVIVDDFVLFVGGAGSTVGSYVHIASFTSITGGGAFDAADFATISSGCRILTGSDDFLGDSLVGSQVPPEYRKAESSFVRLEKHSLLGANVVVLPGVTVGEGAAVGAGSLVSSDLKPWTTYVGVPARPVKERPRAAILEMALKLLEGS